MDADRPERERVVLAVTPAEARWRLDELLAARIPVLSRMRLRTALDAGGVRQVKLFELELARLEGRLDVFDEMEVSLLRLGVVRVAGHGDVTLARFLVERRAQFRPVQKPAFEVSRG